MSVLAKKINSWFDSSQELLKTGFEYASKAGEYLAEAQELAGEGFEEWLNENCSFSISTAEKLIDLFKGEKVKLVVSYSENEREVQEQPEET
jgi:hypothetical protein